MEEKKKEKRKPAQNQQVKLKASQLKARKKETKPAHNDAICIAFPCSKISLAVGISQNIRENFNLKSFLYFMYHLSSF